MERNLKKVTDKTCKLEYTYVKVNYIIASKQNLNKLNT